MTEETNVLRMINDRLTQLDGKIERVAQLAERVAVTEQGHGTLSDQVTALASSQSDDRIELAELRGSHRVITWVGGAIGGPTALALILAGIASLFHIKLGG